MSTALERRLALKPIISFTQNSTGPFPTTPPVRPSFLPISSPVESTSETITVFSPNKAFPPKVSPSPSEVYQSHRQSEPTERVMTVTATPIEKDPLRNFRADARSSKPPQIMERDEETMIEDISDTQWNEVIQEKRRSQEEKEVRNVDNELTKLEADARQFQEKDLMRQKKPNQREGPLSELKARRQARASRSASTSSARSKDLAKYSPVREEDEEMDKYDPSMINDEPLEACLGSFSSSSDHHLENDDEEEGKEGSDSGSDHSEDLDELDGEDGEEEEEEALEPSSGSIPETSIITPDNPFPSLLSPSSQWPSKRVLSTSPGVKYKIRQETPAQRSEINAMAGPGPSSSRSRSSRQAAVTARQKARKCVVLSDDEDDDYNPIKGDEGDVFTKEYDEGLKREVRGQSIVKGRERREGSIRSGDEFEDDDDDDDEEGDEMDEVDQEVEELGETFDDGLDDNIVTPKDRLNGTDMDIDFDQDGDMDLFDNIDIAEQLEMETMGGVQLAKMGDVMERDKDEFDDLPLDGLEAIDLENVTSLSGTSSKSPPIPLDPPLEKSRQPLQPGLHDLFSPNSPKRNHIPPAIPSARTPLSFLSFPNKSTSNTSFPRIDDSSPILISQTKTKFTSDLLSKLDGISFTSQNDLAGAIVGVEGGFMKVSEMPPKWKDFYMNHWRRGMDGVPDAPRNTFKDPMLGVNVSTSGTGSGRGRGKAAAAAPSRRNANTNTSNYFQGGYGNDVGSDGGEGDNDGEDDEIILRGPQAPSNNYRGRGGKFGKRSWRGKKKGGGGRGRKKS